MIELFAYTPFFWHVEHVEIHVPITWLILDFANPKSLEALGCAMCLLSEMEDDHKANPENRCS